MCSMTVLKSRNGFYEWNGFSDKVVAGFSTRAFNHSTRDSFIQFLGLESTRTPHLQQVHSQKVAVVTDANLKEAIEADAVVTQAVNLPLCIQTADCLPLFISDSQSGWVGLVHAGWRGLRDWILEEVLKVIREQGCSLKNLKVGIGPSIRGCCYETGPEFFGIFPEAMSEEGGRITCDLVKLVKLKLADWNIEEDQIMDSGICTACQTDEFYSYRREQTDQRIYSVICKRS